MGFEVFVVGVLVVFSKGCSMQLGFFSAAENLGFLDPRILSGRKLFNYSAKAPVQ